MHDQIQVFKIDVDSNPDIANSIGVRGLPSLFIYKNGEIIANRTGATPKAVLKSWIEDSI